MIRIRHALAATLLLTAASAPLAAQEVHRSAHHDFRVVSVADGLVNPWAMAWLPNGDMLVTERPGRLRIVRDGRLLPDSVPGVPPVFARGQGGLLDVQLHPDFASNRLVYLSYSKPLGGDESTTAIVRGRLENDALVDVEEVFEAQSRGRGHYGSRLVFDGEGHLFVSVGDRQAPPRGDLESHPAQDRSNHHGVVLRISEDGAVPTDNPFVAEEGVLPEIWSFGHRNIQGMTMLPDGRLVATEHGPQGGDEVNFIEPGANYGWPVVGYGVNYGSGSAIHEGTMREGMANPAFVWVPSIGTSGLVYYDGDRYPGWRGSLFAGGLSGQYLSRLVMDGDAILYEEVLAHGIGRVRDVRQGPDGYLYLAIEDRRGAPTSLVRLEPVARR